MLVPDFETFRRLMERGNLIPVYREHLADMETPVSVFARFAREPNAFLLESVEGGERWGRYSFIGFHPRAVLRISNNRAVLTADGREEVIDESEAPFFALRRVLQDVHPVPLPDLPRFTGGAVGYIGYETALQFERLPPPAAPSSWPTAQFLLTDTMVVFDNVRHTMKIVASVRTDSFPTPEAAYEDALRRIEAVEERMRAPFPPPAPPAVCRPVSLESNMTRVRFREMVRRAKDYIVAGDVIQVVLSQRFSTPFGGDALTLYRALRLINPSPYMFLLKLRDRVLVGSSPEIMVRKTGNRLELRPIAGTRPRGRTEQEDRRLADELLADEKERAEHVMLVDLGRNDLGRVSTPGSVQVREYMTIERYSHVMHIVSHVEGMLRPGLDGLDVIRAVFPAGTLTGAPKIRAMEIIAELEPCARGPYGGALGYIGYDGNVDLAITIRTLLLHGETASVQAGAGIVYDSDPDREYQETVNKARGMLRALETAADGLVPATIGAMRSRT